MAPRPRPAGGRGALAQVSTGRRLAGPEDPDDPARGAGWREERRSGGRRGSGVSPARDTCAAAGRTKREAVNRVPASCPAPVETVEASIAWNRVVRPKHTHTHCSGFEFAKSGQRAKKAYAAFACHVTERVAARESVKVYLCAK